MKTFLLLVLCSCLGSTFAQDTSTALIIQKTDSLIKDYKFQEALSIINEASDSLNSALLQRKGWCYSKLGNYGEAILAYQAIIASDSLSREALYNLGQLYSLRDQHDMSGNCFKKLIRLDSANSFYYKQYAAIALKSNDPITAISYYVQSLHLNPRDIEAYNHLSGILLDAEQYPYVDSMLTSVLSWTENNQLRLLLARAKLGQNKYQEVIENVQTILEDNDTTVTYARLLAISHFQLDHYEQVIPFMQFLLARGVKADWIYYYLGVSYQQLGQVETGIEYLNLAVEESISDHIGTYYTQLASAYEQVKDFRNAIRNYKIAYETSKADILLYHLARNYDVYYKDKTQAEVYYRKYLESDDTVQLAKKYSQQRLEMLSDGQ